MRRGWRGVSGKGEAWTVDRCVQPFNVIPLSGRIAIGMDGLGDEGDGEAIRLPTAEYLAPSAQRPNCPDKADMGAYGAACANEATKSGVQKHG
jgi:hypothetical protein